MNLISRIELDQNNQELLGSEYEAFSYTCKYVELKSEADDELSWHWHPAFEIEYIEEGELECRLQERAVTVRKGEALFINSDMIHSLHLKEGVESCRFYADIFDTHFLSGTYNSLMEQKYISPVLKSRGLGCFVISPDHANTVKMIDALLKIHDLNDRRPYGYEFEIRSLLGQFWCLLLRETETLRSVSEESGSLDADRVKTMMKYIQDHYMEKLTLKDIAAQANIGSRECTRCFQRSIGISPVSYLNQYRIQRAKQFLLQSSDSILDISERCGFSSTSYFGKVFFDQVKSTPREYRSLNSAV